MLCFMCLVLFICTEEPVVRCFSHGQSNPTYFIQYGDKNLVLRKKPVSDYNPCQIWPPKNKDHPFI